MSEDVASDFRFEAIIFGKWTQMCNYLQNLHFLFEADQKTSTMFLMHKHDMNARIKHKGFNCLIGFVDGISLE